MQYCTIIFDILRFFIWQLVVNLIALRNLISLFSSYGFRFEYDFIRLILLSIEQILVLIYMPLLIVRMGIYLVRCLPCIGTRNLDDMCKNASPNGQAAPFPQQGPTLFVVNQQPMGGVVQIPMGVMVQPSIGMVVQQPMGGMMGQQPMGGIVVQQPMGGMEIQNPKAGVSMAPGTP